MPELSEEEIEKLVEQKFEEKKQELREEIKRNIQKEKQSTEDSNISRRKFLKTSALGLGGLAFSSLGASWYSVGGGGGGSSGLPTVLSNNNRAGNNNIDLDSNDLKDGSTTVWDSSNSHIPSGRIQSSGLNADTVDNQHATDLGGANYVQNTEPGSPEDGEIWVDTSQSPPEMKVYDSGNSSFYSDAEYAHVWEYTGRSFNVNSGEAQVLSLETGMYDKIEMNVSSQSDFNIWFEGGGGSSDQWQVSSNGWGKSPNLSNGNGPFNSIHIDASGVGTDFAASQIRVRKVARYL